MPHQRLIHPGRPVEQLATAIGATLVQRVGTFGAEGALERADEGTGIIGGQIDAAAFAIGAHFQHAGTFSAPAPARLVAVSVDEQIIGVELAEALQRRPVEDPHYALAELQQPVLAQLA
jgi:hypothetical protein